MTPDRAALRQLFEELEAESREREAERAARIAAGHVCFPAVRRMHCWQCECGEVIEPRSVLAQLEERAMSDDDLEQGPIPPHLLPAKEACDAHRRWSKHSRVVKAAKRAKKRYDFAHVQGADVP